jgi:hypothetical protein
MVTPHTHSRDRIALCTANRANYHSSVLDLYEPVDLGFPVKDLALLRKKAKPDTPSALDQV